MEIIPVALLIAQAVTVTSLVRKGMAGIYPVLVLYLIWSLLRGGVLLIGSAGPASETYATLFLVTLPVTICLQVFLASEAYRRSMSDVPGASRLVHYGLLSGSLLAASVVQLGQVDYGGAWILARAQQAVATTLGLAALGITAWIGYVRPSRRRNTIIHERIVTAHLVGLAILGFLYHRGVETGVLVAILSIICCTAWTFLLSEAGEKLPPGGGTRDDDRERAKNFGRLGRSVWMAIRER